MSQHHVADRTWANENVNEKQNYLDYFFYPSSTRKGYELEENVVHLFLFVFSLSFLFSHIWGFNFWVCRTIICSQREHLYKKIYSEKCAASFIPCTRITSLCPLHHRPPSRPAKQISHRQSISLLSGLNFLCFICKNKWIYVCMFYYFPF